MSDRQDILNRVKALIALNVLIVFGLLLLLVVQVHTPRAASNGHNLTVPASMAASEAPVPSEPDRPIEHELSSHFGQSRAGKAPASEARQTIGKIALVVDDLGFSSQSSVVKGMLALPIPITASIIPGQAASDFLASKANLLGHDVIAHVPMEPLNSPANTDMTYLNAAMSHDDFFEYMDAVANLPYATGLSNHQGSAATQDSALMTLVANWCSQHGWYVFDSITHPGTLLYKSARTQGVSGLRRDIFLDHHQHPDSIRARLQDAVRMAQRRDGVVRIIAHPRASTLDVLQQELPRLVEQGIVFMRLSDGQEQRSTIVAAGEKR